MLPLLRPHARTHKRRAMRGPVSRSLITAASSLCRDVLHARPRPPAPDARPPPPARRPRRPGAAGGRAARHTADSLPPAQRRRAQRIHPVRVRVRVGRVGRRAGPEAVDGRPVLEPVADAGAVSVLRGARCGARAQRAAYARRRGVGRVPIRRGLGGIRRTVGQQRGRGGDGGDRCGAGEADVQRVRAQPGAGREAPEMASDGVFDVRGRVASPDDRPRPDAALDRHPARHVPQRQGPLAPGRPREHVRDRRPRPRRPRRHARPPRLALPPHPPAPAVLARPRDAAPGLPRRLPAPPRPRTAAADARTLPVRRRPDARAPALAVRPAAAAAAGAAGPVRAEPAGAVRRRARGAGPPRGGPAADIDAQRAQHDVTEAPLLCFPFAVFFLQFLFLFPRPGCVDLHWGVSLLAVLLSAFAASFIDHCTLQHISSHAAVSPHLDDNKK